MTALPATKREPLVQTGTLLDAVGWAAATGVAVIGVVLIVLGGWDYYRTPLSIRGYAAAHRLLRPSGVGGHLLGLSGTMLLLSTLFYVARKKVKALSRTGTLKGWLEIHIFCGVAGPILITLHTSFKFNGIVSVAFWSMVLVMLSGFVGRYLYVRIPKSIRGKELSSAEIEQRAMQLKAQLAESMVPEELIRRIEELEQSAAPVTPRSRSSIGSIGERFAARQKSAALRREIRRSGISPQLLHQALDLANERAALVRSMAKLKRNTQLFQIWHAFHRPLVWVMFLILSLHLMVVIYFGYTLLN